MYVSNTISKEQRSTVTMRRGYLTPKQKCFHCRVNCR